MHCTNNLLKQIIRFFFVGGSAFVLDFALLWVFTDLIGINYLSFYFLISKEEKKKRKITKGPKIMINK